MGVVTVNNLQRRPVYYNLYIAIECIYLWLLCTIIIAIDYNTLLCLDDVDPAVSDSDDTSSEQLPNKGEARPKSPGMDN